MNSIVGITILQQKIIYRIIPNVPSQENLQEDIFPRHKENLLIAFTDANSQKPFMVCITNAPCDLHFVGAASGAQCFSYWRYDNQGNQIENLTDWSLSGFQEQ